MKEKITTVEFLKHSVYKKSITNFCSNFFISFIKDYLGTQEGYNNLVSLLKWDHDSDESQDLPVVFSEKENEDVIKTVSLIIKKIIENLVKENVAEEEFYSKIWSLISDDSLLATETEKMCAVILLFLDSRIPYFQMGQALQMDNKKYQKISKSINSEVSKALFVLNRGYSQYTEVASQLYKIINEIDSDEKRIVLLAKIIGSINLKYTMLFQKLQKMDFSDQESEDKEGL